MLTARRGLGPTEHRLVDGTFLEAVHWALFAEHAGHLLASQRAIAAEDPPDFLTGADRVAFQTNRALARGAVARLEGELYPADEDEPE